MFLIDFFKKSAIIIAAIIVVIFMYCIFIFKKILVPGILIAYLFKLNLLYAIFAYLAIMSIMYIIIKLLNRPIYKEDECISIEEFLN